ncbi:MAG: hypothetical protein QG670_1546, partial [Thermoproteota archaeon]|nr:hypothetical protein [Thermoproteota archaeon]
MAKREKDADQERLLRIISLCLSVENRGGNPFEVEVREILEAMRRYLPNWKVFEDFNLDSEALNRISSIIRLQGNWIKHRSSSLYVDPLLIEMKIRMMTLERLYEVFSKTWRPIIGLERLSARRIKEAIDYWNQLPSFKDRRTELPIPSSSLGSISYDELVRAGIVREESFQKQLQKLHKELMDKAGEEGRISYQDFIREKTYEETVHRAYLTSFLITYGYATMEMDPIEETAFLIPYSEPKSET